MAYMPSMKFHEVLKLFGTQTNMAKQLDVTRQATTEWKRTDNIPRMRQYQIELLTKGKLRAERP